jgi:hypothetical protein
MFFFCLDELSSCVGTSKIVCIRFLFREARKCRSRRVGKGRRSVPRPWIYNSKVILSPKKGNQNNNFAIKVILSPKTGNQTVTILPPSNCRLHYLTLAWADLVRDRLLREATGGEAREQNTRGFFGGKASPPRPRNCSDSTLPVFPLCQPLLSSATWLLFLLLFYCILLPGSTMYLLQWTIPSAITVSVGGTHPTNQTNNWTRDISVGFYFYFRTLVRYWRQNYIETKKWTTWCKNYHFFNWSMTEL